MLAPSWSLRLDSHSVTRYFEEAISWSNDAEPEDHKANGESGVSGERAGLADYAARSGFRDQQGETLARK